MSLEDIISRIRTDAETEAEAIREKAAAERQETERTHARQVEEQYAKELERLKSRMLDHRRRMEFHIRREAGRRLLGARRSLIDGAITGAAGKLAALGEAGYLELVDALIAACTLTGEVEVLIAETDSRRITADYLGKRSTKERRLSLSKERHEAAGGVIFRSGRVSENATFPMIAKLAHEDLVMRLSPRVPVEGTD